MLQLLNINSSISERDKVFLRRVKKAMYDYTDVESLWEFCFSKLVFEDYTVKKLNNNINVYRNSDDSRIAARV